MSADLVIEPPFDDEFSADPISAFLCEAIRAGGAAMVAARLTHLTEIKRSLQAQVDLDPARIVLLDAEATLAAITRDGELDEAAFMRVLGDAIRPLIATGKVHAYGEMVDLLLERGRHDAVLQFESMWSKLLASVPFGSFFAYRQHVPRSLVRLEQRARILEDEVERRTRLEARMLDLLDFTGKLTAAHTRAEVARLAIEVGMTSVEAAAAALWTVSADGNYLELAAASTGLVAAEFTRIPLDEDVVVARGVRDNRPIFLGSLAQYERDYPSSFQRGRGLRNPAHLAFAILPVVGEGKPLGGLWLAYVRERVFDDAERSFKQIVGRHCGLALERVELLEAEQRARAESELLYTLTSEVAVADDLDAVYGIALDAVKQGTRADRTAILLFDDGGVMRFKAWRGISDTYRAAVEGHTPWQRDDAHPMPVTVDDTELDPAWASYRDVFRAEGIRALAFVPLISRKKLIGKFMLYRNEPQPFTAREIQLATTVAFHVGESLARKADEAALARAYAEEKEAHAAAEEATRAREEILSVVSHDLRNPLGTVMLGAGSLLQIDDRRVAAVAGSIHRQAERMARLIEDLVDFAGIQAGKLALARVDHAPTEIISAATDLFGPLAQERGLVLETTVQPDLPSISCDSERALQVLANLMSNALKVTPKGGQVKIGVESRASDVVFFVNDTGPGISATELPQIFERYWRGKTSQYRGAGLGLSIARGIVDAHGGKIWAESTVGVGSTFYFSLAPSN